VAVQNVPLKNCFGLFQAASYGSKQSTSECARAAVIRRATSHIKKQRQTPSGDLISIGTISVSNSSALFGAYPEVILQLE
jgi:hypothetical protein